MAKKLLLLLLLIPSLVFGQNQGDDLGLGQGATAVVGRVNDAFTSTATGDGKSNYFAVNRAGQQYVIPSSTAGESSSIIQLSGANNLNGSPGFSPLPTFVVADTAEAASTTTVVNATAHVARVGDLIEFTGGTAGNIGVWSPVCSVAANAITVCNAFPSTPVNTDPFNIYRLRVKNELYAEDSAHASTDVGTFILGVRSDSQFTFTSTDSDYSPFLLNRYGAVTVDVDQNFQRNSTTGLLKLEDVPAVGGDSGVPPLYYMEQNPTNLAASGDYANPKVNLLGYTYVDPILRAAPTHTQPTVTNTTSFTCVSANAARRYLFIQNNSSANIMINLNNGTLTGIIPTSSNLGIVLVPGASYETGPNFVSTSAVTCYQSSGGSINTISVIEG